MANKPEKKMSREEAVALYNQLQSNVSRIMRGKVPPKAEKPGAQPQKAHDRAASQGQTMTLTVERDRGVVAAISFLLFCGMVKLCVGVIDYLGVMDAPIAQATMVQAAEGPRQIVSTPQNGLSTEEVRVLTALDGRRVELDEKNKRLEEKERDLTRRDKEYVVKLAELRELTDKLKIERQKEEKKGNAQLDQLANIYGSMAPQEAAKLIEQLDVTIALPLLQRMPEKRMGQILPLMTPDRALTITKLLTGGSK